MATGYLVQGVCYASQSDAADAYFSAVPVALTAGPVTYRSYYEKVSGAWRLKTVALDSASVTTDVSNAVVVVPGFPSCDPTANYFDGLAVGWSVVALMVAAWGAAKVRRQAG